MTRVFWRGRNLEVCNGNSVGFWDQFHPNDEDVEPAPVERRIVGAFGNRETQRVRRPDDGCVARRVQDQGIAEVAAILGAAGAVWLRLVEQDIVPAPADRRI